MPYASPLGVSASTAAGGAVRSLRQVLVDPGGHQGMGHGEHYRPDEDADQAERDQAADDADENQQQGQVRPTLPDEKRPQDVVQGGGDDGDDQQERAPARRARVVEPDDGA